MAELVGLTCGSPPAPGATSAGSSHRTWRIAGLVATFPWCRWPDCQSVLSRRILGRYPSNLGLGRANLLIRSRAVGVGRRSATPWHLRSQSPSDVEPVGYTALGLRLRTVWLRLAQVLSRGDPAVGVEASVLVVVLVDILPLQTPARPVHPVVHGNCRGHNAADIEVRVSC